MIRARAQPLCRWCGRPFKRYTDRVRFVDAMPPAVIAQGARYVVGRGTTIADCQRYAKGTVTGVTKRRDGSVIAFHEWDRESYYSVEKYFCTRNCALQLARAAVEQNGVTGAAYEAALAEQAIAAAEGGG